MTGTVSTGISGTVSTGRFIFAVVTEGKTNRSWPKANLAVSWAMATGFSALASGISSGSWPASMCPKLIFTELISLLPLSRMDSTLLENSTTLVVELKLKRSGMKMEQTCVRARENFLQWLFEWNQFVRGCLFLKMEYPRLKSTAS